MSPHRYLALDLGASSCRAIVGTWTGERMAMREAHRFETPIVERDGHLFWDLGGIEHHIREGLRRALRGGPLRSLSVDSWAVDYVPVLPSGRPLRDAFCYRDHRTEGIMESVFDWVPADEIYRTTGIQFLPFNTLYQTVADARDGTAGGAARCLTIADWFNYRLGAEPVIERSMASSTQMVDVGTGRWADFLDRLEIDRSAWPDIVEGGTITGRTGDGIAVVCGCSHDTAAAVAATPAEEVADWAYVSCGTWSLLGVELDRPILTDEARRGGFTNEAGLDGTVRFLRNLTGLWPLQECVREWEVEGTPIRWKELERQAERAGPSCGTIDLDDPVFTPRGGMEARLRRAIRDAGLHDPPSRGHLARIVLESIVASYARTLEALARVTGRRARVLHLVGGGARNGLLCRLAADACGIEVVAGPDEATALGNLLVQARAMGDLPPGMTVRLAAARSSTLSRYEPRSPA